MKACPPLPVITGGGVKGTEIKAAREHFLCHASTVGGQVTPGAYDQAMRSASNWVSNENWKAMMRRDPVSGVAVAAKMKPVQTTGFEAPVTITMKKIPITDPVIPERAIIPRQHPSVSVQKLPQEAVAMAGMSNFATLLGTGVGGPIGGTVGGLLGGLLGGIGGSSQCPGPYNYNPLTGGCDPKPGSLIPQEVPLPPTPGITTPAEMSVGGWQAVTDEFGIAAVAPQVVGNRSRKDGSSAPILGCPAGSVLGKNNLCYRGTPPGGRKWKKPARPILSAQDGKILRRVGMIQKRVKKAAGISGFTCKKR